jgi:hypothetical protein
MTEVQTDKMLAYLDVIAMQTAVIAAQGQQGNPLSADEVEQVREASAQSVLIVYETMRQVSLAG